MSISGLTNTFSNPNPRILNYPQFNLNCPIKLRVCAKVASPEPNARVHRQSPPAPVKLSSATSEMKKNKEDEDKRDYYLNMGYAIRSLREEFPELFYREPRFDIYREDIVFKDPINTFAGIENYKSIFWALRFHGRLFFRALWVDIVSVWQPMDNVILIRWTIHGIPRVPWESRGRFDGLSEYKLDKNGKIYEHKVDNIALNSSRTFQVLSVQDLIQSLSCPTTPKPTCFEVSSSSSSSKSVSLMAIMRPMMHYLNSAMDTSQTLETESSRKS